MNTQDWSPLGWVSWISLQSKGLSRVFSLHQHHSSKASVLQCSAFFMVQLSHPYMTGKNIVLTIWTFVGKVMSLLFNTMSRFVIIFLSVFSSIGVFSNELALCSRWSKYGRFSFSPSNEYSGWFPLGWTGLISMHSKRLSRVFSSTTILKYQFFGT